ncbi:glycosyltransferase [Cesiribacter sp. SM1]|uniref:glycosyltransferase n=1 Tax=Cesiribacter sp. SM1 TaxID=2861196 RepID=UPI001CD722F3|nr:glycosyltransferase [Cesiribacter sp. SM1]
MILFLSAYPPREYGVASYSYHLIQALKEHFDSRSLAVEVCALEGEEEAYRQYSDDVRYVLNTSDRAACREMAHIINGDPSIQAVCIQHRFGLWGGNHWGDNILDFLEVIDKPLAVVLHNVLPEPDAELRHVVKEISKHADLLITPTKHHASLLGEHYQVPDEQIRVVLPGAPVVSPYNKESLKEKHQLSGKLVLASSGLLRRSKGIEHVLNALEIIRETYPDVVYLILGETHPTAYRYEGDRYRIQLKDLIFRKKLQKHVRFVNRFLSQEELLEYMCMSDVYIHNSRNNLSSLAMALSSGNTVLAEDTPAVAELLQINASNGTMINLKCPEAIAATVTNLLEEPKPETGGKLPVVSAGHPLLWPNTALAYQKIFGELVPLHTHYKLPELKPDHLYRLTTSIGLLHIDLHDHLLAQQGYLLKDNAKALVATLLWYRYDAENELLLLMLMRRFLNVIRKCQQPDGSFINQLDDGGDYVPEHNRQLTEESSMQAMWALATLIERQEELPADLTSLAQRLFNRALPHVTWVSALKASAYAIKALYLYNKVHKSASIISLLSAKANCLQTFFDTNAGADHAWFEKELGTENGLLPEAMLMTWMATGEQVYKNTAYRSFRFLVERLFSKVPANAAQDMALKVINEEQFTFNSEPLEVSQTILMLNLFYQQTGEQQYLEKMYAAFSWFMGNNCLRHALYNPANGGCYDGLKHGKPSSHQGAESQVSYLLSRLTLEKYTMQLPARPKEVQETAIANVRGVPVAPDRPSMPSGQVKVIAN